MLYSLESDSVGREGEADHQGREEILEVSSERALFIRHAEKP